MRWRREENKKIGKRRGKRERGGERERDSYNEGVKIVVTSSLTLYHVASPKMQPR